MKALLLKEINQFFSSLMGYVAIVVFLLTTGYFVWLAPGDNVLSYGFANLNVFFELAPLVLLLLAPAITMRSFAEEFQTGTIELLITKPIKEWQVITSKYLAALIILAMAIIPTMIYIYSIYELGLPKGNLDLGATLSSYIGLLFLASAFLSVGLFSSALTNNQIIAFIIGLFTCYFLYRGFDDLSSFPLFYGKFDAIVQAFGLRAHYSAIRKGVLDTRDLIYFITFILFFVQLTLFTLRLKRN